MEIASHEKNVTIIDESANEIYNKQISGSYASYFILFGLTYEF